MTDDEYNDDEFEEAKHWEEEMNPDICIYLKVNFARAVAICKLLKYGVSVERDMEINNENVIFTLDDEALDDMIDVLENTTNG